MLQQATWLQVDIAEQERWKRAVMHGLAVEAAREYRLKNIRRSAATTFDAIQAPKQALLVSAAVKEYWRQVVQRSLEPAVTIIRGRRLKAFRSAFDSRVDNLISLLDGETKEVEAEGEEEGETKDGEVDVEKPRSYHFSDCDLNLGFRELRQSMANMRLDAYTASETVPSTKAVQSCEIEGDAERDTEPQSDIGSGRVTLTVRDDPKTLGTVNVLTIRRPKKVAAEVKKEPSGRRTPDLPMDKKAQKSQKSQKSLKSRDVNSLTLIDSGGASSSKSLKSIVSTSTDDLGTVAPLPRQPVTSSLSLCHTPFTVDLPLSLSLSLQTSHQVSSVLRFLSHVQQRMATTQALHDAIFSAKVEDPLAPTSGTPEVPAGQVPAGQAQSVEAPKGAAAALPQLDRPWMIHKDVNMSPLQMNQLARIDVLLSPSQGEREDLEGVKASAVVIQGDIESQKHMLAYSYLAVVASKHVEWGPHLVVVRDASDIDATVAELGKWVSQIKVMALCSATNPSAKTRADRIRAWYKARPMIYVTDLGTMLQDLQ
ncbi:hypothetical protein KIPB_004139, partial [Kipferlia bialata]|eukprot:g4139.t1